MVDGAATYKLQEGQGDNPESFTEIYSGEGLAHGVTPPENDREVMPTKCELVMQAMHAVIGVAP